MIPELIVVLITIVVAVAAVTLLGHKILHLWGRGEGLVALVLLLVVNCVRDVVVGGDVTELVIRLTVLNGATGMTLRRIVLIILVFVGGGSRVLGVITGVEQGWPGYCLAHYDLFDYFPSGKSRVVIVVMMISRRRFIVR